jgi:hypothetical protein
VVTVTVGRFGPTDSPLGLTGRPTGGCLLTSLEVYPGLLVYGGVVVYAGLLVYGGVLAYGGVVACAGSVSCTGLGELYGRGVSDLMATPAVSPADCARGSF